MSADLAELDCGACGTKTAHQRASNGVMACIPCTVRRDMAVAGAATAPAQTHVHVDGYRWTLGRIIAIVLFLVLVAVFVAGALTSQH